MTLVPPDADQVLLCRYDGPFGGPRVNVANRFRLVARRVIIDRGRVSGLAAALDALPKLSGSYACPDDTGAAIVAFFRYASAPDSPVRVDLTGCMTATNGRVIRTAGILGTAILDRLEALVHSEPVRPGTRSTAALTANIDGYLRLCGGPAPGRCFISTIGLCAPPEGCVSSDRVVAIDTSGAQVAQQTLRPAHGRFRLRVRPGQYAVELLADGKHVRDRLLQTEGATAHGGRTTSIVFSFDVP